MSDPTVDLYLTWRTVPASVGWQDEVARTGPEPDHLRVSLMPSFHYEPRATTTDGTSVRIDPTTLTTLEKWPDTVSNIEFRLRVARVSDVMGQPDTPGAGISLPLEMWRQPTQQDTEAGCAILTATLNRTVVTRTPAQASFGRLLREGASTHRRFRIRGYDDMPNPNRSGASLHEGLKRRSDNTRQSLIASLRTPPTGQSSISARTMTRAQERQLYQNHRIFLPANASFSDRLDSRRMAAYLQPGFTPDGTDNAVEKAQWSKCHQELTRLAGNDNVPWESRLYARAILIGSLVALDAVPRSAGVPAGSGLFSIDEALELLTEQPNSITPATVARLFHVTSDYVSKALALWKSLSDTDSSSNTTDLPPDAAAAHAKATRLGYLNLLRYHIATHPEPIDCGSAFGGNSDDDANDIDNLLAGLTSWPTMARLTALCFDFKVDKNVLLGALGQLDPTLAGPFAIRIVPTGTVPADYPQALHEVHCWTVFTWGTGAPETDFWPAPKSSEISGGTLNLPGNYQLRSEDVDADAQYATRQSQNLDIADGDGHTAKDLEVRQKGSIESGLTLVATAAIDEASASQDEAAGQESDIYNNHAIVQYAEDLVAGYRIDVSARDPGLVKQGPWLSLCDRQIRYQLNHDQLKNNPQNPFPKEFDLQQLPSDIAREEGMVHKIARQTQGASDNPDELTPNNILCQWRDHNLSVRDSINPAQDPFTADGVGPTQAQEDAGEGAFPFRVKAEVTPHSQPLLRDKWQYFVGARVTYANGSSLGREIASRVYDSQSNPPATRLGDGGQATDAFTFIRCEPIRAPQTHLAEPIDTRRFPGDEIDTVVVRSATDLPANEHSTRWIVPPRKSLESAEIDGAFDRMSELPDGALRGFKLDRCGAVPGVSQVFPDRCPTNVLHDSQCGDKKVQKDPHCNDTILVRAGGGDPEIPYYPDPRAKACMAALVDDPSGSTAYQLGKILWYTSSFPWPDARPILLSVSRSDGGAVVLRSGSHVISSDDHKSEHRIELELPPGTVTYLQLWSTDSDDSDIRHMNISKLKSLAGAAAKRYQPGRLSLALATTDADAIGDGSLPTHNPRRTIQLVHAVQKPLRAPRFGHDFAARRFLDSTTATAGTPPGPTPWDRAATQVGAQRNAALLEGTVEIDRATTARVDIKSERYDWIDDPIAKPGPCRQHIWDTLPPIEPIDPTVPHDSVSLQIDDLGAERNIWHDLKDTKHHHLSYHLTATSAFRSYFHSTTQDGSGFTLDSSSQEPLGRRVHVLSTQRPDMPDLDLMLPSFQHETTSGSGWTQLRRRVGLKLWLNRPWFSSGNDEKLAIICGPGNLLPNRSSPDTDPAEPRTNRWTREDLDASGPANSHLLPYVSQIALDPTAPYGELIEVLPSGIFLDHRLPDGRCKTDSNLVLAEGIQPTSGPPLTVSAALFDVGVDDYDCDRRQYGINVGIDLTALAWQPLNLAFRPFIRLALARYQPYSTKGLELSRILVADMIQLQPNRTLQIAYDPLRSELIDVRVHEYGLGETTLRKSGPSMDGAGAGYTVSIDLLRRAGSSPRLIQVDSQSPPIEKIGDGYLTRARFTLDRRYPNTQYAIRVRESLQYTHGHKPNATSDAFDSDQALSQPVLFMLQPLWDESAKESA